MPDPAAPPVAGDERLNLPAYAYEVRAGDLLVDEWENTQRLVTDVTTTASGGVVRETTLTFDDGGSETYTNHPARRLVLDVRRWRSLIPGHESPESPEGEPAA